MKSKFLISCSFAALAAHATPALSKTEIVWWHSMTAVNN